MTIKEIHDILDFYLKKNQSGFLSLGEKDAVLHRAQVQYMDKIKPAYPANQQLSDALTPFKRIAQFTNSNTVGGLITLPANYQHLLSVETTVMDSGHVIYPMVEMIGEDELGIRRSSQLIPVSVKNPIGYQINNFVDGIKFIQLYPEQPAAGKVYFLCKPIAPKYAFTTNGRAITYDHANSVQLEWNEPSTEKIIMIALQLLGIPLEDDRVIQVAAAKEGGNQ
jgi:hypothetical protein